MEEAAFRAFYLRTANRVRAYLVRACGQDWSLAEDLMQEAYYRLLRSGFSTDDDSHRTNYLFRIATNLVKDHYRRKKRSPFAASEANHEQIPATEMDLEASTSARELTRQLGQLLERDRQLLWLAHVEGLSHREIATALGLKSTSIRSMLFRARGRLAQLLDESKTGQAS